MKNIYFAHPRKGNFVLEFYNPLKILELGEAKLFNFVLPHLESQEPFEAKNFFQSKKCMAVIAEVSQPATGLGIELGWADLLNIPIYCIYKESTQSSGSLRVVTSNFYSYKDESEFLEKIKLIIHDLSKFQN